MLTSPDVKTGCKSGHAGYLWLQGQSLECCVMLPLAYCASVQPPCPKSLDAALHYVHSNDTVVGLQCVWAV